MGNPAHLWEHPPVQSAKRDVDCMGGMRAVVKKVRVYPEDGDLRFASTLLSHAVFAGQEHEASVFERLGYGAENGNLASISYERFTTVHEISNTSASQLEIDQLPDTVCICLDGFKAQRKSLDDIPYAGDQASL
jgi:alkyl sulfatase BDS1-like metallo-beta-lactamase superfamily hydrolase